MKHLVPILLVGVALGAACTCGGPTKATQVTLRFHNTGADTLYVDDTNGILGLQVQSQVNGAYATVDEDSAACCQSCDDVCAGTVCPCATVPPTLLQVDAGATVDRVWNGVWQQQVAANCGLIPNGSTCERAETAGASDTFNLHVCYASSFKGTAPTDGGLVFEGTIPTEGVDCADKVFHVKDGIVEVTPTSGKSCTTSQECGGTDGGNDQLCFSGTCTNTCPNNGIPLLGSNWSLNIPLDDDNYFLETTTGGQNRYTGTGIVGTVQYQSGTMTLDIHTGDHSGTASIYATLPENLGVPFNTGEMVDVTVVDPVNDPNHQNLALVIRQSGDGGLLLAADMADQGFLLNTTDTAPFTVSSAGKIVGCAFTDACGKITYDATHFAGGTPTTELIPGQTADVTAAGSTFTLLNVSNSSSSATVGCTYPHPQPYAILNKRIGGN